MVVKECKNCHQMKEHHAKGLCLSCYKKLMWKPKEGTCKYCGKKTTLHAKGLCATCYNKLFHQDKAKAYYHRKSNKIDIKTYKKLTKSCAICGFDKIVDIFHIDKNKQNNSPENLVGLCPNHHRMANSSKYRHEIYQLLKQKGFKIPLEEEISLPHPKN